MTTANHISPGMTIHLDNKIYRVESSVKVTVAKGTPFVKTKLRNLMTDELIEKNNWREKVRLTMQVHDELVFEIAEDIAEATARTLRKVMEDAAPIEDLAGVPIIAEASMGTNWGEMEKIEA